MGAGATTTYAKCDPGRGSDYYQPYHDGWWNEPGGTVGGAYTSLLNYSPWVYPISSDNDSAWTMLHDSASCTHCDYAQVGWTEYAGDFRDTFVEWTHDGTFSDKYFTAEPVGSYTTYSVLYSPSTDVFTFQVANDTVETVGAQFTPDTGEQYGETQTLASQMPGGYNSGSHEVFSNAHIYARGQWVEFNGIGNSTDSTYFKQDRSSNQYFQIWDSACPN